MALLLDSTRLPHPANPDAAAHLYAQFQELGAAEAQLAQDPAVRALLHALGGNSPYLGDLAIRESSAFCQLVKTGPDAVLATTLLQLAGLAPDMAQAALMAELRTAKRRAALTTAVADIAGWWDVPRVTAALSDIAETALSVCCRHLLRAAHDRGELRLRHPDDPARGSGLIVLGMGKLGARELNYSSDVDLIVLYDPDTGIYQGDNIGLCFVRIARGLVKMMEERTADGYVFRTDLRLRPDPGATPMAMALPGALSYYESMGQTWERAAMIKARPVAGDTAAGQSFLKEIRPFVWRRNLDFAAMADIHTMKARIHAHKGGEKIAVLGHNVKLGRGGIREAEFTAQALQLIWGGRDPALRTPTTLGALALMADAGKILQQDAAWVSDSYLFLRRVEHRLQMVDDRQTHSLPDTEEGLERFSIFMGYRNAADFSAALLMHLRQIEQVYSTLFDTPGDRGGSELVFDGRDDDPGTLRALAEMGFTNPPAVIASIRGWRTGRARATRLPRARELLHEITPNLLAAIARQPQPDSAFMRLDAFLTHLPAGVQVLSLLQRNPGLLDQLALMLGSAPRQADYLARNPSAVEGLLSSEGPDPTPGKNLRLRLGDARNLEETIEITRRFVHEQRFNISAATLQGLIDVDETGLARTALTEVAFGAILPRVQKDFASRNGRVPGGAIAVLGMGKLGGREMMANSDLDLIIVYDHAPDAESSIGRRAIVPQVWFSRFCTSLVAAMTAPGVEGELFSVDMRLRPSGNKGPVAVRVSSFERYQAEEAWTWERMALTRARLIAGQPALKKRIQAAIDVALTRPNDPDTIRADAVAMRARLLRDLPASGEWDVKHCRGGQVEVEFIAQVLQLIHAPANPKILSTTTRTAFANLARAGFLPADDATVLIRADRLWRTIQGILRLTVGQSRDATLPLPAEDALLRALRLIDIDLPTVSALRDIRAETAEQVSTLFTRHIGALDIKD